MTRATTRSPPTAAWPGAVQMPGGSATGAHLSVDGSQAAAPSRPRRSSRRSGDTSDWSTTIGSRASRALAKYGAWRADHTRAAAQRCRDSASRWSSPGAVIRFRGRQRCCGHGCHIGRLLGHAGHDPPRCRPRIRVTSGDGDRRHRGERRVRPVTALGRSKPSGSASTASGSGRSMLASQDRYSIPARSPTAPRTRSARASSDAPNASQAAVSRATASQLRGLGHARPGLVGDLGDRQHQGWSHLEERRDCGPSRDGLRLARPPPRAGSPPPPP